MKNVVRVLGGSFVLSIAAWFLVPDAWMWPVIGTILFFGIFVAMRLGQTELGDAIEKKFNGD